MSAIIWSGKAYLTKTVVKFAIIFVILSLLFTPLFFYLRLYGIIAFFLWCAVAGLYFVVYYFNKRAYTFYISERAVRIDKSWVFGTYQREATLDKIRDVHINQGMLARLFNCGSLRFVTTTGLEVGYAHAGAGIFVGGGAGRSIPTLVRGRGNTFWDIPNPPIVRRLLMDRLTGWREAFQQRRVAESLEEIAEKPKAPAASLVSELERLKALLDTGAITEEEYEKAKTKLLE